MPGPPSPESSEPRAMVRSEGARGDFDVVRTLLPYLKPYRGRIVLSLLLILGSKLATLTVPLALKQIVDRLNVERTLLALPVALLLAYGAARISVTLFTETRQVVFARVMARAARQIGVKVFRHLHDLSLKFHLDRRTGGVARDLERGTTAVSDLLDWSLYTILPTILEVVLVTAVLLWKYDIGFALIILGTLAAYAAWSFSITEWRTRFYRAAVEADTRAKGEPYDRLAGPLS
ncbi:MAG TPA: ABC transporter transmembrane domain-containing protein, partial [Candidatus Polarisedimenticolia bacterium]|nr:ABC transporter transmembrane domain-containing protein [Candidatus Polarisedimenticolia bacterium]